jgi:hypothetical protein
MLTALKVKWSLAKFKFIARLSGIYLQIQDTGTELSPGNAFTDIEYLFPIKVRFQ